MAHYFISRVRCQDGQGVRIALSRDGQLAYTFHRGNELKFADRESAHRFIQLVKRVGLTGPGFTNKYRITEVNDG